MANLCKSLLKSIRLILLCLCLCSLIAFLFAQNEHFERSLNAPLDLIHRASLHLEEENHVGSLSVSLVLWDGTLAVGTQLPFIRQRLTHRSLALSPQLPPPKFPSA